MKYIIKYISYKYRQSEMFTNENKFVYVSICLVDIQQQKVWKWRTARQITEKLNTAKAKKRKIHYFYKTTCQF